jgi:hypothetical protein
MLCSVSQYPGQLSKLTQGGLAVVEIAAQADLAAQT